MPSENTKNIGLFQIGLIHFKLSTESKILIPLDHITMF